MTGALPYGATRLQKKHGGERHGKEQQSHRDVRDHRVDSHAVYVAASTSIP
jgi:hypothetical protein